MIKLCLNSVSKRVKVFLVNLVSQGKFYASLLINNFQASIIDGYDFREKSPTNISLPKHQPEIEFIHSFRNYEEFPFLKHNYHNQQLCRLNKKFHTKYNLNTEYLKIFITKSYMSPCK